DQTLRVARRAVQIDDDLVVRMIWRYRDGGARDDPVIGADRTEAPALERRRFHAHNFEFDDFRGGRTGEADHAGDQYHSAKLMPHGVLPMSAPRVVPPRSCRGDYRGKCRAERATRLG